MIPQLKCELESFKEKMKERPDDYIVVYQPGYTGGGSLDLLFLFITAVSLLCIRRFNYAKN
jgi:rhombotail lipoprotein